MYHRHFRSSTAAIGSGSQASCGDITIKRGSIITDLNDKLLSVGIGAGYAGTCGNITIAKTVTDVSVINVNE